MDSVRRREPQGEAMASKRKKPTSGGIEWVKNADGSAGKTWGVLRGCSRISPGCGGGIRGPKGEQGGCYAEGIAGRFSWEAQPEHANPTFHEAGAFHGFAEMRDGRARWTGKVALVVEKLAEPLRTRKPTTWFISMSDLFHEGLAEDVILAIIGVMAAAAQHTFQVLTKRSGRMLDILSRATPEACAQAMSKHLPGMYPAKWYEAAKRAAWPLPNVWWGVSVETEKYKSRLDDLRACPAAVRFVSFEPLLGDLGTLDLSGIHQAITGSESGRGARPMVKQWVRNLRDQATAQGVAFFFKQELDARGHKVRLPLLDGRQWDEMPARAA